MGPIEKKRIIKKQIEEIQKHYDELDEMDKKEKAEKKGKMEGGKTVKKIESDPTQAGTIFKKSVKEKKD